MSHSCAFADQAASPCVGPGIITTGPCISGRELHDQINHGLSFITRMVISGYAVFSRRTVAPSLYSRSYTGRWWQYYASGYDLLGVSGISGCGRADHECYRVSEHHCGPVAPLHDLCFSCWKWNVPTGQRTVSQGYNCVGVVPGT
ncbi:uncharacterized protein TNCV_4082571 [Trichonephila clavipes]|nr:uncharacterized protein TNCV_4082571 [Trichonephila clavipes]